MNGQGAEKRVWLIIPAAGVGKRMQAERPKQYLEIEHKTILQHTLDRFEKLPFIHAVVIAVSPDDDFFPNLKLAWQKPFYHCHGGKERYHSVYNALCFIEPRAQPDDWVMVHDAARPCVRAKDIRQLYQQCLQQNTGGILAYPVKDTLKQQGSRQAIAQTLDRSLLWHALTPQMFPLFELKAAISSAMQQKLPMTDDASAMEVAGKQVLLVNGHEDNIKITRPADLSYASWLLHHLEQKSC